MEDVQVEPGLHDGAVLQEDRPVRKLLEQVDRGLGGGGKPQGEKRGRQEKMQGFHLIQWKRRGGPGARLFE